MKIRHHLVIVFVALCALFITGCASDHEAQTQSVSADTSLLSVTDLAPGSTYELRVYVIARGDTVGKIAKKFGISIRDFEAINPGLIPFRLKIGQQVRIYEKPAE